MKKASHPTKNPHPKNSVQAKTWTQGYEHGLKNEKNIVHTKCPVGVEDFQLVWDQGFVAGRKDQKQIPTGVYCYKPKGTSVDAQGRTVLKTKVCPFYGTRHSKKNQDKIASKSFCTMTRVVDDLLLNDQCKVCGVKDDDAISVE